MLGWIIGKSVGCPYKKGCGVKYTSKYYCGTAKHLKCIDFQVLRDKENKDKCSECGGHRWGESIMHNDGCSKCVTSTTGVSMNDYYNKSE
ncbi:MAG: hypothetical protein CEE42_05255 [Promethearchaeota archaeon Loki_b31]|nr:MAG: hypothetical protein CEE42_05255 [Candidatus Lokiarchaeota archaeon Loki_b31]